MKKIKYKVVQFFLRYLVSLADGDRVEKLIAKYGADYVVAFIAERVDIALDCLKESVDKTLPIDEG